MVIDDPVLTRILGRYDSFGDREPDFTPSDAISLALLAKSENSRLKFYKYYYERAFAAVVSGLGLAKSEALVSSVRKFVLQAKDQPGDWLACFTVRQKLHQLADLPALEVQSDAPRAVVDWYVDEANRVVAGVQRIDAAICGFLGWDPALRVPYEALVKSHNFPDRAQLKTFFRPTGLQNAYKAYEGLPEGRGP